MKEKFFHGESEFYRREPFWFLRESEQQNIFD